MELFDGGIGVDRVFWIARLMIESSRNAALPEGTLPDLVEFHRYWASLPTHGLMPSLSDYLDHAPPHLQPNVGIADVLSPTQVQVRLYGTALLNLAGKDATHASVNLLYADHLKPAVGQLAWLVVSHPFGYLGVRSTRTGAGRLIHSPCVCLPIQNRDATIKMIINYSHIDKSPTTMPEDDKSILVHGFNVTHMIDLGAGLPGSLPKALTQPMIQ